MPADHNDELHEWAGAYALGALDPTDRRRFERHLADCARCATEIRALAPIPGLLAQLDTDDLDSSIRPETADAISRRIQHETQQLRTSRNRWRLTAITAAALVIAVIAAIAVGTDDPSTDTAVPAVAAFVTSSLAESTDVTTTTRGWGTQVDLDLTGLPARPRYQLWAIDDDGTWSIAATWGPTETGRATITGATATPTTRLGRLVVTSDDTDDIIIDATT
jgi:anti-sigma-K factor RskA